MTRAIRCAVFALISLVGVAASSCVFAQSNTIGFPSSTSCPSNAPPLKAGTDPGTPGQWTNPNRYGTGWDFYFSDDHTSIVFYWLTYNASSQPVWLTNGGTTWSKTTEAGTGAVQFAAPMFMVSIPPYPSYPAPQTNPQVGEVAIVFVPNSTTIAAIRWKWTGVVAGVQNECVYNLYHSTQTTGAASMNEAYTGEWFDPTQSGWGLAINVGSIRNGNATGTLEIDNALIYDTAGQPTWLQGSQASDSTISTASATMSLYYFKSKYPGGVPTQDCSNNSCVKYPPPAVGSVMRAFTGTTNGQPNATITANVAASVTGGAAIAWPNSPYSNPSLNLTKATDHNYVAVDQTTCSIQAPQTTCPLLVSWASSSANARVYKRSSNVLSTTPISSASNGQYTDNLGAGADVIYELHDSNSSTGALLYKSAEVKTFASLAPMPDPVTDTPPTHDATTGTMAGQAGTDGGAATYNVPIVVPPGRAGMQPSLSLNYNSRSGNGMMGVGWTLSGLSSIHRCPQTPEQDGQTLGVSYANTDRLCLDGQRLVLTNGGTYGASGAVYHTEIDNYARITQVGGDLTGAATCFKVEQKDGRILHYGAVVSGSTCSSSTAHSRVQPKGASAPPLSWLVEKIEDRVGNNQLYTYTDFGSGEVLPATILYTGFGAGSGDRKVALSYVARTTAASTTTDTTSSFLAGGVTMQTQALASITTSVSGATARVYSLSYKAMAYNGRLQVSSIQECAQGTTTCHPATQFSVNDNALNTSSNFPVKALQGLGLPASAMGENPYDIGVLGDLDGDGTKEAIISGNGHVYVAQMTADRKIGAAVDLGGQFAQLNGSSADLDGSGRTFVMQPMRLAGTSANLVFGVWSSGRGAPLTTNPFTWVTSNIPYNPSAALYGQSTVIFAGDIDGDGKSDIVLVQPDTSGVCGSADQLGPQLKAYFYKNKTQGMVTSSNPPVFDTGKGLFCLSRTWDNGSWYGPSIDHIADFDGDGLPDFFLTNGQSSNWRSGSFAGVYRTNRDSTTGILSATLTQPLNCDWSASATADECQWQKGYVHYWMDINGDGLEDFVFARPNEAAWHVRLNQGGGAMSAVITPAANGYVGLTTYSPVGGPAFRYGNKLPAMDVDGTGTSDILIPSGTQGFALKMCTVAQVSAATSGDVGSCPQANTSAPITAGTTSNQCAVYYCPENPGGGPFLPPNPQLNTGDPKFQWNGLPAYGSYSNSPYGGQATGNDTNSIYHLAALKFVQTGVNAFSVQVVETPLVSGLRSAYRRTDDLFGDGLADLTISVGCQNKTVPVTYNGITTNYQLCSAVNDNVYGPATFIDGTSNSTFNTQWSVYGNINQGTATAVSSAPTLPVTSSGGGTSLNLPVPMMPGLLNQATNGVGDSASWSYAPLSVPGAQDGIPFYSVLSDGGADQSYLDGRHYFFESSMPAVSAMTQSSGIGTTRGARSAIYGYNQAIYNHLGRGFEGFRKIISETLPSSTNAGRAVRTTTRFNQKFPLVGKVDMIEQKLPSGSPFHTENYTYTCSGDQTPCPDDINIPAAAATGGTVYQPLVSTQTIQESDLQTGAASGHVATINTWDAYGNLTAQTVNKGDDGSNAFLSKLTTQTNSVFVIDTTNWWVDKLDHSTVTNSIFYASTHAMPGGSNPPAQSLTATYTYNTDRTVATKTVTGVANEDVATAYTYPSPSYGLPSQVQTCLGTYVSGSCSGEVAAGLSPTRTTTLSYTKNGKTAAADGYFVLTTTNALNQSSTTTRQTNDGQVLIASDPNGVQVATTYDAFGRATEIDHIDGTGVPFESPIKIAYTKCSNGSCPGGYGESSNESKAAYRITTVQDGYPTKVDWYDMLGREIKTAERGYAGTFIDTLTMYDEMGTVSEKFAPFYDGSTAYFTSWSYDALNRPTVKDVPSDDSTHGDFVTSYTYSGRTTNITAHAASVTTAGTNLHMTMSRSTNALGQYMQTVDANGKQTNYWTEPLGHVAAITDVEGNLTTAGYNALGQRISSNDPDQGAWTFSYDGLGELLTQTDARGLTTTVNARDALGRTTAQSVVAPATAPTGFYSETVYDTWSFDPPNGIGELGSATRRRGASTAYTINPIVWKEAYTYDDAARPAQTTTTTTEGGATVTMASSQDYDNFGRKNTHFYPSNLAIQTQYGAYGHPGALYNVGTSQIYWEANAMDARNKVTSESYADGTTGTINNSLVSGQELSASWNLGGSTVDSLTYSYDSLGNLTKQIRTAGSYTNTETYTYDVLQRLKSATPAANASAVNYSYSDSGNLLSKSDFGSSYIYGNATTRPSGCGPHAATSAGGFTYQCDANGNVWGGSTLAAQYDAANHPRTMSRTGGGALNWAYDVNGQRSYESSSTSTRYFGPAGYEQLSSVSTGKTVHELGPIIVTRTNGKDTMTTSLRDRLGSTIDTIDGGSQNIGDMATTGNPRHFDAFGAAKWANMAPRPHGTLSLSDTVHGYTSHTHADDAWLVHMGGRVFDYSLGRFLSVDPIISNPLHSQSLNPYSYIGNNPLSGTDPTGYAAACTIEASNSCAGTEVKPATLTGSHNAGVNTGVKINLVSPSPEGMASLALTLNNGHVTSNASGAGGNTPSQQTSGVPTGSVPATQPGQQAPNQGAIGLVPSLPTITVRPLVEPLPPINWGPLIEFTEFAASRLIPPLLIFTPGNIGQHCAADGCGCGSICTQPVTTPGFGDTTGIRGPTTMTNENAGKDAGTGPLEDTPSTNPDAFRPIRGAKGKEHTKTGEVWERDLLHKNHYEVYKDRKSYEKGTRDRSVWDDGRPKEKF